MDNLSPPVGLSEKDRLKHVWAFELLLLNLICPCVKLIKIFTRNTLCPIIISVAFVVTAVFWNWKGVGKRRKRYNHIPCYLSETSHRPGEMNPACRYNDITPLGEILGCHVPFKMRFVPGIILTRRDRRFRWVVGRQ